MKNNIYGIILAGGSGSRLWPLSREMYPKQLLKLTDENTLFQSTFLRMTGLIPIENIVTITNVKHQSDLRFQLDQLRMDLNYYNEFEIIAEPVGRNTAPAIGLTSYIIKNKLSGSDEDPVILVTPADHMIRNNDKFMEAISEGVKLAENGKIVTFGIKPDRADSGYGYIKTVRDDSISKIADKGYKVLEFKEKPDPETAKKYLDSGDYYWNSGIFLFKYSVFVNELEKHSGEILKNLLESRSLNENGEIAYKEYIKMPDISIDYAVMEHSENICLIPVDCGWNDMGSWESIFDMADKDEKNNFIYGNVIDVDSENSLFFSTSKLLSTIGLQDTVIVETEDAILACRKDRTQDVKKVYEYLKENNDLACIVHKTVYKPWGSYTVLQKGDGFLVKILKINPEAKLSLQMHYHRSEHWMILSGIAKVRKEDEETVLHYGDKIDIPATVKHIVENPGKIELKILETQTGAYLEEDDIVRYEDIYGRIG